MKHVLKVLVAGILFAACSENIGTEGYEVNDGTSDNWAHESLAVSLADDYKVAAAACDNGKKVLVCHVPPGNPDNRHTICISENAVTTHIDHHKDYLGDCAAPPATPGPDASPSPAPSPNPDPGASPMPTAAPSPAPSPTPDPDAPANF